MHECLSAMCEADVKGGRLSIAPEKLVRAMLLQVLYSVRTERQLVEQINYDLLFRRFVGLSIEDEAWNHAVFSKIRDRMIEHDLVIELFNATVNMARAKDLLLGEQVPALPSCDVPIGCSPEGVWETGVTPLQDSQKGRPGEQPQECQIDR